MKSFKGNIIAHKYNIHLIFMHPCQPKNTQPTIIADQQDKSTNDV